MRSAIIARHKRWNARTWIMGLDYLQWPHVISNKVLWFLFPYRSETALVISHMGRVRTDTDLVCDHEHPRMSLNLSRVLKKTIKREMVPRRGLEPPRCYPLLPESSASTNSATWACLVGEASFTVVLAARQSVKMRRMRFLGPRLFTGERGLTRDVLNLTPKLNLTPSAMLALVRAGEFHDRCPSHA